jgi:hypothetical protein
MWRKTLSIPAFRIEQKYACPVPLQITYTFSSCIEAQTGARDIYFHYLVRLSAFKLWQGPLPSGESFGNAIGLLWQDVTTANRARIAWHVSTPTPYFANFVMFPAL